MANLKKIYHNWTAYNVPVTSVNNSTGDVTVQETLVSWTNIKTINNTSLLWSGNIDIQSWGNYTAGNWIDITNDEIWLDGTYSGTDYSAMQWPAPEWFHVPSKDEWVALCWILTSTFWLEQDYRTMSNYLKMPMAGLRYYNSADVYNVGSNGRYWSSTPLDANNAYYLYFYSSYIYPQYSEFRAFGFSVRCFKDIPVIPTSSWTTLYDWSSVATGAWVFYNATDGLISVSGNWTTWYTIQDKNLWATTVYNQWDTFTDANCGYFYQWGNNYWFAHSWDVTTSSTRVDASNYWPWNYYSSGTFITVSSSPYDRSSVKNDNLWGGETWIQTASWNLVLWDNLYKIVTSTTAPASWTASNIITIVTD